MNKTEALELRDAWRFALQSVAAKLGYKPTYIGANDNTRPILSAMGSLAWGRSEADPRPDETKDDVVEGLGYLKGYRDAMLRAARAFGDGEADRLFCDVPKVASKRIAARSR